MVEDSGKFASSSLASSSSTPKFSINPVKIQCVQEKFKKIKSNIWAIFVLFGFCLPLILFKTPLYFIFISYFPSKRTVSRNSIIPDAGTTITCCGISLVWPGALTRKYRPRTFSLRSRKYLRCPRIILAVFNGLLLATSSPASWSASTVEGPSSE